MAQSYNKFNAFVADVHNKVHNLASDQLEIALSDTAPVATDTTVNGEIAYTNITNGATTGRNLTTTSSTQTAGVYSLILQDLTITATGNVAQFRYVIIRNKTANKLIGWYDIGSEINMINGSSFKVDLDNVNGLFQDT